MNHKQVLRMVSPGSCDDFLLHQTLFGDHEDCEEMELKIPREGRKKSLSWNTNWKVGGAVCR